MEGHGDNKSKFLMELVCQTQELNRLERLNFLIFSYWSDRGFDSPFDIDVFIVPHLRLNVTFLFVRAVFQKGVYKLWLDKIDSVQTFKDKLKISWLGSGAKQVRL